MSNTDMIGWFAKDGKGVARDLWSTSYGVPAIDSTNSLIQVVEPVAVGNRVKFETRRLLDTGDSNQDYAVTLGETTSMIYGYNSNTSSFVKHNKLGFWSLKAEPPK